MLTVIARGAVSWYAVDVHTGGVARVIAGEAGGRRLAVPDGRDTRPTSDRAREALFATVTSLVGALTGARVLDLYAGSGAVGLEALSRGAEHVLLVEQGSRAARVIRQNIAALGLPGAVLAADRVERVLARGPSQASGQQDAGQQDTGQQDTGQQDTGRQDLARYDVVFADPPYALPAADVSAMLVALATRGWLAPGALVIVERATRSGPLYWPDGFIPDRARRYGEATFWYARARKRPGKQPPRETPETAETAEL
jgi:16S rRNA (guanine966-N2)-methyltransferase